jgi:hypothetical protein
VPLWAQKGNKALFGENKETSGEAKDFLTSLLHDPYEGKENNRFGAAVNRLFDTQVARARSGDSQAVGTARQGFREGSALSGAQDAIIGQGYNSAVALLQGANPYANLEFARNSADVNTKGTARNESVANQLTQQETRTDTKSSAQSSGQGITICCYIFIAANDGIELPNWVRTCRDLFCSGERVAGYRRMSRWLVPMMMRSSKVTSIVRGFMTKPMTAWGGWLMGVEKHSKGWLAWPVVMFWFTLWKLIGRPEDLMDYPEEKGAK